MKKNVLIIFGIMIVSLVMLSSFSISYTGTITATTVRLREEPDSSSSTLQLIGLGKTVEILDEEGDWYKVTYDGITGYIAKDYVTIEDEDLSNDTANNSIDSLIDVTNNTASNQNTESEIDDETLDEDIVENEDNEEIEENIESDEEETATTFTLNNDVDIRSIPSFTSNIINTIESGSEVTVLITLNKWVKITAGNVTGWVIRQNT